MDRKHLNGKRLLVISPHFITFVREQVIEISKYVDDINIIIPMPFIPEFMKDVPIMKKYSPSYDLLNVKDLPHNIKVDEVKYITLPLDSFRGMTGDFAFKKVDKFIKDKEIKFDIVHAHFTWPYGYAAVKLGKKYNVPVVITIHENRDWFLSEVSSDDEKLMYTWQNSDRLIRVNERDLEELQKLNINRSRLLYIPNGYSSVLFKPIDKIVARKKLGLPTDMRILLNIAALKPHKGQISLIESLKNVVRLHEDVMLYIVGNGPSRDELKSAIDEWGLQDNVILAGGNKVREEIPLWMNACDLFVLPSLSESFGVVQIEAMACGKPVVATRNGGSEEIIINDMLGILVEPKDVAGLSKAILRAIDTNWDREYILDYAKQFRWEEVAKNIVEVYDELITSDIT